MTTTTKEGDESSSAAAYAQATEEEKKSNTFRKRRLSLDNLRRLVDGDAASSALASEEQPQQQPNATWETPSAPPEQEQQQQSPPPKRARANLTNLQQLTAVDNSDTIPVIAKPVVPIAEEQADLSDGHVEQMQDDEEKAHTFRKRRLSLTHSREDSSSIGEQSAGEPATAHNELTHRRRRLNSDASISSLDFPNSKRPLKSRVVHSSELLSNDPPSSAARAILPRLYEPSAPPLQQPLFGRIGLGDGSGIGESLAPKWRKRHTRHLHEDERILPFPRDVVGTFSCHGVEPIYDSDYQPEGDDEDQWDAPSSTSSNQTNGQKAAPAQEKLTTAAKINQDRGGVAFPYGNCPRTALFAAYDGTSGEFGFL
jgi:hypothetical protein